VSTAQLEARAERLTWRLLRWLHRRQLRREGPSEHAKALAAGPFPDAVATGEHALERLAAMRRRGTDSA
jgi:hypothetical protein